MNDVTCFGYFQGVTEAGVLVFLFFFCDSVQKACLKKNQYYPKLTPPWHAIVSRTSVDALCTMIFAFF